MDKRVVNPNVFSTVSTQEKGSGLTVTDRSRPGQTSTSAAVFCVEGAFLQVKGESSDDELKVQLSSSLLFKQLTQAVLSPHASNNPDETEQREKLSFNRTDVLA